MVDAAYRIAVQHPYPYGPCVDQPQLSAKDAVYSIDTREFVRSQLGKLEAGLGPATFGQLMGTVDPSLISQMRPFLE